ncbi:SUMF1/EgtB/PvdO family nonheme iron enzyme [Bacteroidales bacterium AH-315-N07]|nr:SUMF1/EgtB/PvdO family nonheme iron enzyme [Bacteroidales bacterium AH-315-N07]
MKTKLFHLLYFAFACLLLSSCGAEESSVTGWSYNDPSNGGFEVVDYIEMETGPGLILIEGGRLEMGGHEQEIQLDWDNMQKTTTVPSFYMDETEIANIHYLEYLYWIQRVFWADYPEVYNNAMVDTLVWRKDGAFNEPYVELYLRHPAYHFYPVVGVSWVQAMDFCRWRTDRVNEMILIREGVLRINPDQYNEDNFNTDAYLYQQYEGLVRSDLIDLNPNRDTRKVRLEDGIILPRYRLPTEAEWEFAALGLLGNLIPGSELRKDSRVYPWNGHTLRNYEEKVRGNFMANFVRE